MLLTHEECRQTLHDVAENHKAKWRENLKLLEGNEKKIYELLIEKGGYALQGELCKALNLSKSTVSLTIKRLKPKT